VVSSESSGILLQALNVVERTVLPRAITFTAARGRLDLVVSGQCALIGPKLDGAFVVDEQFRREAPEAYDALRLGALSQSGELPQVGPDDPAMNEALTAVAANREALLRLWGRTLVEFCSGASRIETTVKAASPQMSAGAQVQRRLDFSALELLSAVSPHISAAADSQVLAFYSAQKQTASDAWLFHSEGWPAAFPGEVAELGRITEMGAAARTAREWRNNLADISGPIMSVMLASRQDAFRCVAVDDAYVALVTRPSAEIGSVLAAWRSAQQGRIAVESQV
jgi:hypothetical protein